MSLPALNLSFEPLADRFHRDGYLVVRGALERAPIHELLEHLRWLCEKETGATWSSAHSVSLAQHLAADGDLRRRIMERAEVPAWLTRFALQERLVEAVQQVLGHELQLLRRVPVDITAPLDLEGLDVWHQDHFYVRGSTRTVSAWVPLQLTGLREGCLMVMPGSHRIGPVAHDNLVLGRRHFPSGIAEREVRMVETEPGDVVLLHSMLLHTTAANLSPACRFVVRPRFIPRGASWSRKMLGTLDVL
jgi:ectoine hydroxylase-related dioxygenase (phytanoyl-CoA dioxygenase family)